MVDKDPHVLVGVCAGVSSRSGVLDGRAAMPRLAGMGIAVFLDDKRDPPPGGDWTVARTSREAIRLLAAGGVTYISFDHDLVDKDNGMKVVDWIDERATTDPSFEMPAWGVHSLNPVGVEKIRLAMTTLEERLGLPTRQTDRGRSPTKRPRRRG